MSDRFQRFAARDHSDATLARLTDDEVELLLGRRKYSPVAMSIKMHRSESTIHRMQKSIMDKIG
jgi:hypothetical protein